MLPKSWKGTSKYTHSECDTSSPDNDEWIFNRNLFIFLRNLEYGQRFIVARWTTIQTKFDNRIDQVIVSSKYVSNGESNRFIEKYSDITRKPIT